MGSDITDFRIDQLRTDVVGRDFPVLRHFRQGLGQVDEGFAAIGVGEEKDCQRFLLG